MIHTKKWITISVLTIMSLLTTSNVSALDTTVSLNYDVISNSGLYGSYTYNHNSQYLYSYQEPSSATFDFVNQIFMPNKIQFRVNQVQNSVNSSTPTCFDYTLVLTGFHDDNFKIKKDIFDLFSSSESWTGTSTFGSFDISTINYNKYDSGDLTMLFKTSVLSTGTQKFYGGANFNIPLTFRFMPNYLLRDYKGGETTISVKSATFEEVSCDKDYSDFIPVEESENTESGSSTVDIATLYTPLAFLFVFLIVWLLFDRFI